MTRYLRYVEILLRVAFSDFAFGWSMVLGAILAAATLALEVRWKLISLTDWREHAWQWIASVVLPFIGVLALNAFGRMVNAPYRVHQEQESKLADKSSLLKSCQSTITELELKLQKAPRPKIIIRYLLSSGIGVSNTLSGVVYENVGERTAHDVHIVPDKSTGFWIEQVDFIDLVSPDGTQRPVAVNAMMRSQDQEVRVMDSKHDPLRILAATMVLEGLEPKLNCKVCYSDFDSSEAFVTRFVFRLDHARNPHFEQAS